MDFKIEKELFDSTESGEDDCNLNAQQERYDESLKRFDETVKTVSRNMRKGDWAYLNRHPEIRAIIRVIVTDAIRKQPDDIFEFAASLFDCNNHRNLTKKINKQLKWVNKQVKIGSWDTADGLMLFPESSSSSVRRENCDDFEKESSDYDEMMKNQNKCPENLKP